MFTCPSCPQRNFTALLYVSNVFLAQNRTVDVRCALGGFRSVRTSQCSPAVGASRHFHMQKENYQ